MSAGGQQALQDMVELQMYLVAQAQQSPWPMCPRSAMRLPVTRMPYSNLVESSVAWELLDQGFIEATSSRTFIVSKSGYQFYQRQTIRTLA
jgi:hypothetical protein